MISPQQGLFHSIQTSNCKCDPHRFQAQPMFLLPRFIFFSSRQPHPKKLSVNLAKLKEDEEVLDLYEGGLGGKALKQKVENIGINWDSCTPGQYTHLICPLCKGGESKERSLSFHINQNEKVAMWRCFNFECGWAGHVLADVGRAQDGVHRVNQANFPKKMTEENLRLEPLGDEPPTSLPAFVVPCNRSIAFIPVSRRMMFELAMYGWLLESKDGIVVWVAKGLGESKLLLIDYFAERMISPEILEKNYVMQTIDDKNVIAYTYRRNGELVNCKFRSITSRKFWQVEGEIDKLSMEQAGILNCVSVPDGAPQQVSTSLPSKKQDTRYKYLLNCKGYLDKASQIVLATDGDGPGRALAEELSCCLGKERCWLVTWPKKDEFGCYKDANEVTPLSSR
ncbi:Toprim domain-containing protein [Cynara cardunculus var. scolymus]|uniref:Toprim domain-containing protein n=1 Tax=Cynara cardunculus var. scolymus TaxID=59895 RepID=A0A103Y1I7_CYNCS|nr:Toprim domain-containing protein [Cynara cardunculus var. scolymus]